MVDEFGQGMNLTEVFKESNRQLIETIKKQGVSENEAQTQTEKWFDAHAALGQSDEKYPLVFMPAYIEVLTAIKDNNPGFINTLDQYFDEDDEYNILGNPTEEISETQYDEWDNKLKGLRTEIRLLNTGS